MSKSPVQEQAAYRKPPSKIRIGYQVYTVKPDATLYARDETWGECYLVSRLILFDPSQHPLELIDTIIHEVNHVLFSRFGFKSEKSSVKASEERIVHNMTHGLLQVLLDNPKLRNWMNEVIHDCLARGECRISE